MKWFAWIVLFIAVALVFCGRPLWNFLDEYSGRPISSQLSRRIAEPKLMTFEPVSVPPVSPLDLPPDTPGRSEAATASARNSRVPGPLAAESRSLYGSSYENVDRRTTFLYDEPPVTPSGEALSREEIPRLRKPDVLFRPETDSQKIRDRKKLDEIAPMVSLRSGAFQMGSDRTGETDQRPRHPVRLSSFEIDRYPVTNRQFLSFVRETGYRTTAERQGWSYVFDFERKRWTRMVGACWWNPTGKNPEGELLDEGPTGALAAMFDFPVVHVSWDDAQAFCRWAGKRLPTEAEWEYAAKGGLIDAEYPWGDYRLVDGVYMANYWQGWFPEENSGKDGFQLLSPVGSFPANRYGLFDMGGNAWQWCADRYSSDYYRRSPTDDPTGPEPGDAKTATVSTLVVRKKNGRWVEERFEGAEDVFLRVIRGGSFLSAENGDAGYRVTARGNQPENLSFQDVGFRCARDITK